jgi:hypothetical protein
MTVNTKKIQILIKYWNDYITLQALLHDTPTAKAIWQILPVRSKVQFWGDEMFFKIPVIQELESTANELVSEGDLCFWPPGRFLCIFFGPTPISTDGSKIRPTGPVNKVGTLLSDYKANIFSYVSTSTGTLNRYFIVPSNSIIKVCKFTEQHTLSKKMLYLSKFTLIRMKQIAQNRIKFLRKRGELS